MTSFLLYSGRLLIPLAVVSTVFLIGCESARLAFEGNPMPPQQVASFLEVVSPRNAYDTPPKFVKGFAPFFPEGEARTRHVGYALAEFTVTVHGTATNVRILKATSYNFAEEAGYTVRDWRFAPAKKDGQPIPVRVRLPFTFRET